MPMIFIFWLCAPLFLAQALANFAASGIKTKFLVTTVAPVGNERFFAAIATTEIFRA
jgi:hypothetical protein